MLAGQVALVCMDDDRVAQELEELRQANAQREAASAHRRKKVLLAVLLAVLA